MSVFSPLCRNLNLSFPALSFLVITLFSLLARQISEFPINRIVFSPYANDTCLLVSAGQGSIRFWRMKNRHLPATSLPLGEHARLNFLDIAFEAGYGEADVLKKKMFVSTHQGTVLQLNFLERKIEFTYKLHSGPIHSLSINEGFCVSASADKYLRVWPLDFGDFYLQVL